MLKSPRMKIFKLEPGIYQDYENFVLSHKTGLFYYSLNYSLFLSELLEIKIEHVVAFTEDKICGILPLFCKEGKYGKVYNSLPFYGSNGGVLANDDNIAGLLIEEYNKIINQDGVAAATLISNPLSDYPYKSVNHELTDSRIGQFTDLNYQQNNFTDLMEVFHYKTRNMIRKAQKMGIDITVDSASLDFIARVHNENMGVIGGQPKSDKFFALIKKYFIEDKDFKIYIATKDGEKISGLLLFYYNGYIEYFVPVIVAEHRNLQPNSLLIYQAMLDGIENGEHSWNWGGTWLTQDGVYRFKSRWGAKDLNYYYYTKINNQDIYNLSRKELLTEYESFYVIPFSSLKQ
jgi:hypothetical protein